MFETIVRRNNTFNFERELFVILQTLEPQILNLNRSQMFEGKDAFSRDIQPDYKPSTKRRKRKKGQPTNRVTYRDKGDHYDQMIIEYMTGRAEITSTVNHAKYLKSRSGNDDYYGLTEESLSKIRDLVNPLLVERYKKHILG